MAKTPSKKPVKAKKPKATDFKDKALSATLERVDSFGSYAAEKVDSLGDVSKEILRAVGRCLGDGVSKVYKPVSLLLEGKAKVAAEAHRIVKLAEADAKAELIQTETSGKKALMDAELREELARRTKTRFVNQELFRQANLEAIIAESIEIAEKEHQETPRESIDDSWMWKFINHAQDVSEQDLRTIWARLLTSKGAGKNIRPITLDLLRLFDKNLATSFGRISLFCSLYTFVPLSNQEYEKTIQELADIGVLQPVYSQNLHSKELSIL
jgi:Protein of unknown function (DUF2806)